MNEDEVLALLRRHGALLEGHFLLTSGRHSPGYVEKFRLLENPDATVAVCAELAARFRSERPQVVLGAVTGGVILAYETARQLGVRGIFAEREAGRLVLRRGFAISPGEAVLLVDDILTTGGSLRGLREVADRAAARIVGAAVLVDRRRPEQRTVEVSALARLDIPHYAPEECPLCRAGAPLAEPGSHARSAAVARG